MIINLRIVSRQLGLLTIVLSGLILAVAAFSAFEHYTGRVPANGEVMALFASAAIALVLGMAMMFGGRLSERSLGQRDAILLVALSWIVGAAVSAVPYFLWASFRADADSTPHAFDNFVDCYFESMSGLTTTGATIVSELASLPRGILLWRALTHWLGGLGIVVLFVAVLPMLGVGGRRIFKIEAPGPTPDGVTPRIQDTARILWLIYMGLTALELVLLRLCGMSWFDSLCHTLATLATGGFSTVDESMAGFASRLIHYVIILFMFLAGVNFGLYHQLIRRKWREVFTDPELRLYITIIAVATCIVTGSILLNPPGDRESYGPVTTAFTDALFQVVSIQTTTGFCSADFDQWGFAARATLLTLMFIGGSAGSTGGGIKVVRIMIAIKVIMAELEHVYRRNVVRTVKVGKATIDPELKVSTMVYLVTILLLFVGGTFTLHSLEASNGADFKSSATAVIATLNNIGPGLAKVGATQNYAWFTAGGKGLMCVLMLLGRLEVFAILVLFSPRFWRGE
ncbi:MAG: TrkH family potassium uptake protein [Planctomycetota bacterium]|jgi:trk system potassium uptake protein TrkH